MYDFFECVAQAAAEKGLRGLAEFVPGGGVVFDIAKGAWDKYRLRRKLAEMHDDVRIMIQATPEELKDVAARIAKRVAKEEIRGQVQAFLEQIPAAAQQSLKRADDPAGKSVPADFSLKSAEDMVKLLPPGLPRFKPGDGLPGRPGWLLERYLGGGGFGEVWLARASFGLCYAVKFLGKRELHHEGNLINLVMTGAESFTMLSCRCAITISMGLPPGWPMISSKAARLPSPSGTGPSYRARNATRMFS